MSPTSQKTGTENIPVKTAIHASFAAMTAAGYASAKNPVTVRNQRKLNLTLSNSDLKTRCKSSYNRFPIKKLSQK
jgi:hypothetical protein